MKKGVYILLACVAAATLAVAAWMLHTRILGRNVLSEKAYSLFIPTGASFDEVVAILERDSVIRDMEAFCWLAKRMRYPQQVKPGRYLITPGMTNKEIVSKLRSGQQDPVHVYIGKYRTKSQLAGFIAGKLEADSTRLMALLEDSAFLATYGLNPHNALAVILSDQYAFYWNTSAEKFIERMHREFRNYWNSRRLQQAEQLNLSPVEVIILASIVEEETNYDPEKTTIAGVYLNRLRKGMKLEADPTVKYAMQNFEARRVLHHHIRQYSPYNTYMVKGLPPGPICIPSKSSIEAVLQAEEHDYLYFCARDDFSGRHVFARTYREHLRNARKFQKALNERNIKG
ncbi:MAG: aminodeoxychorismate lyase [Chitinophagales bacterium]|nr:MAG: aminodeoxychorismate lyase [Chitinophagales bacterium]